MNWADEFFAGQLMCLFNWMDELSLVGWCSCLWEGRILEQ